MLPEIQLLSPVKTSVVSLEKTCRSELQNRVFHTSNARTHASYMLGSTIRKTTQQLCVIPYAMYPPPKTRTLTNLRMV